MFVSKWGYIMQPPQNRGDTRKSIDSEKKHSLTDLLIRLKQSPKAESQVSTDRANDVMGICLEFVIEAAKLQSGAADTNFKGPADPGKASPSPRDMPEIARFPVGPCSTTP